MTTRKVAGALYTQLDKCDPGYICEVLKQLRPVFSSTNSQSSCEPLNQFQKE